MWACLGHRPGGERYGGGGSPLGQTSFSSLNGTWGKGATMPKSKRVQQLTLSKTKSKGHEGKASFIEEVRECANRFTSVYVFTVKNMRSEPLKALRAQWPDSRLFFGRTRQIAVALGRTPESEVQDGISGVSNAILGQEGGLLFTSRPREEVEQFFQEYQHQDFARSGFMATETRKLDAGPHPSFAHSLEPHLRKLGMPTKLESGVVTLLRDFTVCESGSRLTPEQAKLLQVLNVKMAVFRIVLQGVWTAGAFHVLERDDASEGLARDS